MHRFIKSLPRNNNKIRCYKLRTARWRVARALSALVGLGLDDDLRLLLERLDQREVAALVSKDRKLSFQNSQQWLLMGLARAALHRGQTMGTLRPKLMELGERSDLHVIHKVHIARCVRNIIGNGVHDAALAKLLKQIDEPPCGVVTSDVYPRAAEPTSGFHFDYEFAKHEISNLATLFNLDQASVEDAIAAEIKLRWPAATSLDYFPGRERHSWDRSDRYETYRDHIQRHALLSAGTSLSKIPPVVVRSYDEELRKYVVRDNTFCVKKAIFNQ